MKTGRECLPPTYQLPSPGAPLRKRPGFRGGPSRRQRRAAKEGKEREGPGDGSLGQKRSRKEKGARKGRPLSLGTFAGKTQGRESFGRLQDPTGETGIEERRGGVAFDLRNLNKGGTRSRGKFQSKKSDRGGGL